MDNVEGVIIKKIIKFEDERGWLSEIYRKDEDEISPAMCYVSYTKYKVIRGPHEHKKQADFFIFIGP